MNSSTCMYSKSYIKSVSVNVSKGKCQYKKTLAWNCSFLSEDIQINFILSRIVSTLADLAKNNVGSPLPIFLSVIFWWKKGEGYITAAIADFLHHEPYRHLQ